MSLEDFLKSRGLPESLIQHFKDEKINCETIALLAEEDLKELLPKFGDRIAIINFSRRSLQSNKKSLIEKLREKVETKTLKAKNTKTVTQRTFQQVKQTRVVEIGWVCSIGKENSYKQVRSKYGGGTRKISVSREAKCSELLQKAKDLFFPNGVSTKGPLTEFNCELLDFKSHPFNDNLTVQKMYEISSLTTLRFYLATIYKNVDEYKPPLPIDQPSTSSTHYNLRTSHTLEGSSFTATSEGYDSMLTNENLDSIPIILEDPFHNESSQSSLYEELVNEVLFSDHEVDQNEIIKISLHRGHILKELIDEFIHIDITKKNLTINVEMILSNGTKELGLDVGGVFRDALSEFWCSFYESCTNGTTFKVPIIRDDFNKVKWEAVAKIIYVGWKQVKYFPIKLSPIFMENCIFGQSNSELANNFLYIVSESEREIFRSSVENFEETDFDELLDTLSNFDCKRIPNKENVKNIIYDIAHKEIIQKSKYIIDCWEPIICNFIDCETVKDIYEKCDAKPKNVLNILQVGNTLHQDEIKVFGFIKKYIRESDKSTLEKFLRFCTGADLITGQKISIQFKNFDGIQRSPIAHTCSSTLELDITYDSFPDFRYEFNSVLSSNIWVMDFA